MKTGSTETGSWLREKREFSNFVDMISRDDQSPRLNPRSDYISSPNLF